MSNGRPDMDLNDIHPLYQDASQFDFTKLTNYIPIASTILREGHTITTCPALRYSFGKRSGCLVSEGCRLDSGSLEFETTPLSWDQDALEALESVFLWLPMWHAYKDQAYEIETRAALRRLELAGQTFPEHRFLIVGSPYPGGSRPAAIINNTFHRL